MAHERTKIYGHHDDSIAGEAPPNGNGKKWWRETWGKAVGSVLGALLLGLVYWMGTTAMAFTKAANTVFGLPPRVESLEGEVAALKARAPMPADLQDELRAFLKAQPKPQQSERPTR